MDAVRSPQHLGETVRRQRCAQGLTQASLAARCGVSRKWISELENGHPGAELGLVLTVLASLGLEADICQRPATRSDVGRFVGLLPPSELAAAVADEISERDGSLTFRLIGRSLADLVKVDPADREMFLAEPPSTGDVRWDTLIAAAFARSCRGLGIRPPQWTRVSPLRPWWFPIPDRLLAARTMQKTPIDFAVLGIWLDPKALTVA